MSDIHCRGKLIRTRNNKSISHIYYSVRESIDEQTKQCCHPKQDFQDTNIVKSLENITRQGKRSSSGYPNVGIHQMITNSLFSNHSIPLKANKIFCSIWLPNDHIVMGTKCNKLLIYNRRRRRLINLGYMQSSPFKIYYMGCRNGIHALASNPSKTLLATGGPHSNEVAIFSLPDYIPICIGENVHSDWVFDLKWLDDDRFVSCSRDGKIAVWKVSGPRTYTNVRGSYYIQPLAVKRCKFSDRVRALSFKPCSLLAALSTNAYIHYIDMERFEQMSSHKLPYDRETVTLTHSAEHNLFALGSSSHITFIDGSSLGFVRNIRTKFRESGVRSLSFVNNLLTVGTGCGFVNFYDVNAGKYYERSLHILNPRAAIFEGLRYRNRAAPISPTAIYTHAYDSMELRLFTAGGPWAMHSYGCSASIWE